MMWSSVCISFMMKLLKYMKSFFQWLNIETFSIHWTHQEILQEHLLLRRHHHWSIEWLIGSFVFWRSRLSALTVSCCVQLCPLGSTTGLSALMQRSASRTGNRLVLLIIFTVGLRFNNKPQIFCFPSHWSDPMRRQRFFSSIKANEEPSVLCRSWVGQNFRGSFARQPDIFHKNLWIWSFWSQSQGTNH